VVWDEWSSTLTAYVTSPPSVDNFAVKVTVPYLAGMRADFADLRFSKDGAALSHAIWSYTSSTEAEVWVKIASGTTSFTMHYGKADATDASDRNATFLFCDIFDGYFSDHWDHVYRGEVSSSAVMSGIDELEILPPSNTAPASMRGIISKTTFSKGIVIEYRDKMTTNGYYPIVSLGRGTMQDASGGSSLWHQGAFAEGFVVSGDDMTAAGGVYLWENSSGQPAAGHDIGSTAYSALATFEDKRIEWRSDNSIFFYRGDTEIVSATMDLYSAVTDFKILFAQGWYAGTNGRRTAQWIRVRHYVATEPTVSFTAYVDLAGTTEISFGTSGTLQKLTLLAGTTEISIGTSGALQVPKLLAGTSVLSFDTVADLTVDHPTISIFGTSAVAKVNDVPIGTISSVNSVPL
jgi:hypothetical protein